MWNDEGDSAVLRDPAGAEVSRLDAPAKSVVDAPDPSAAGDEADGSVAAGGGERQCAVM